ncbi:MAG: hypothetical protein M1826_006674 [Phylliscum demangeonii]|nr:MAG: hypothetical protein M1826_006674 [Phylliscum demangeonii]
MVIKEASPNRHLSPYERAQIITLHDAGFSGRKIQSFLQQKYSLHCSLSTIQRTIRLDPERNQGHSLKRGPERKTTHEQDVRLAELAAENPQQTNAELAAQAKLSIRTVQRRLREQGLKKGQKARPAPASTLTDAAAAAAAPPPPPLPPQEAEKHTS